MASSTIKVQGLDQLLKNMQQLPRELVSKNGGLVRSALFKSTKLIRDEARLRAPRDTGNIAKNIIAKRDRDPKASGASERYQITVRKKRYTPAARMKAAKKGSGKIDYKANGDAYYWRWVEFGTGPRYSKKTGKYTGAAPAQPFLRPGFESRKEQALQTFSDSLGTGIERVVRKMKK